MKITLFFSSTNPIIRPRKTTCINAKLNKSDQSEANQSINQNQIAKQMNINKYIEYQHISYVQHFIGV